MLESRFDRRRFLAALPVLGLSALVATPADAMAAWRRLRGFAQHPEPRPDVDASHVLGADDLAGLPGSVVSIYDGIREFPHLADGVRCYCGCAELPGYRSLLTCFEEMGMAKYCPICQAQGRLLVRRAREGQTLDEIRRAVDARWGPGGPDHERAVSSRPAAPAACHRR